MTSTFPNAGQIVIHTNPQIGNYGTNVRCASKRMAPRMGLLGALESKNMSTATLMTSAEFLALPDRFDECSNRIKEELIGGKIVPGPGVSGWSKWHDITKNNIGEALALHLRAHPELGLRSLIEIAFEVAPKRHIQFRCRGCADETARR